MTPAKLTILGVDADRDGQVAIAQLFNEQGVTYRFVTEPRKVKGGVRQLKPDLLFVFGELSEDFVIQVLDALSQDVAAAALPVVVSCSQVGDQPFVSGFRSGVVALLERPFVPTQVSTLRQLWSELPGRAGVVSALGDGARIAQMLEHVRRTRRSGVLVASPRTPSEARASFVNGKLDRARFHSATGPEALQAMASLPAVPWSFSEVAGHQGEGANVVIEVGEADAGDETSLAEVVVQGQVTEDEPLAFEMAPAPEAPRSAPSPVPASAAPVRLLMVDDDPTILKMFTLLFAKHGFEVITAIDGLQGVELALQRGPDLVFADLDMPQLDGWGMLRKLRDDFRTRELPIAFISAHDDYRESLRALDAGAQAYVSKGTRLESIIASARTLLEPRRQVRSALEAGGQASITIHTVGPQWLLHQLAGLKATGVVSARDGWASYALHFVDGVCLHASAVAGKYTAEGERAFNAFVASRAADGAFTPGAPPPAPRNLFLATDVLVERACSTLNENETRARETLLVTATHVEVNAELYAVYSHVGPKQWLECARLICEERLPPREIIARLDLSPVDLEETMKDLIRRGVVTLRRAPA